MKHQIASVSKASGDFGFLRLAGGVTRSQSRRATNCATPGYFVIYPAGRVPPKQLRCTRRRIPPKQPRCTRRRIPPRQPRCTRIGAFLLYHNAGKMQVGMARKMRALGNLWTNRLRRSAGLLPQLIGLKIMETSESIGCGAQGVFCPSFSV